MDDLAIENAVALAKMEIHAAASMQPGDYLVHVNDVCEILDGLFLKPDEDQPEPPC